MVTRAPIPTVAEDEVVVPTIPMTYDEFRAWSEREGNHGEWVDGELVPFMTTTTTHARLVAFLVRLIGGYLDVRPVGEVIARSFELRPDAGPAREPDILVVLNEHVDRFEDVRLRGPSDLVVEVVSPDSVTRDHHTKRDEYAAAGIPEYWIVDPRPDEESVQVLVLGQGGEYGAVVPDRDGRLASRILPGLWLDPAWATLELPPSPGLLGQRMAGDAG